MRERVVLPARGVYLSTGADLLPAFEVLRGICGGPSLCAQVGPCEPAMLPEVGGALSKRTRCGAPGGCVLRSGAYVSIRWSASIAGVALRPNAGACPGETWLV